MKYIKIAVAVVTIGLIAFFIWKWFVSTEKPGEVPPPINRYVERIQKDIDSIQRVPDNVFCGKLYHDINASITTFHNKKALGTGADNEKWETILRKQLYSTYVDKFLQEADYIFKHSEWEPTNLNTINKEVKNLQNSEYLKPKSPAAVSLKGVKKTLDKYYEISSFISSCKNYSYQNYDINSVFDPSDKVQKSKDYLNTNMDNTLVNNCTRLKDELKLCPQYLYKKHKEYLYNKIDKLYVKDEKYKEFSMQSIYANDMKRPLTEQIETLKYMDTYGIDYDTRYDDYKELTRFLTRNDSKAYDYFISDLW